MFQFCLIHFELCLWVECVYIISIYDTFVFNCEMYSFLKENLFVPGSIVLLKYSIVDELYKICQKYLYM